MAQQTKPNLLISRLELQASDELESLSDLSLRTRRALGLISLVDTNLVDKFGMDKELNFGRVCERLDEINDYGELLIAQDVNGGRILGALQGSFNEHVSRYDIDYLVVDHVKRGSGVGRELVGIADQHARERSLGSLTLMSLRSSVGFYSRIGFEVDSSRGHGGHTGYYIPMTRPVGLDTMQA